MRDQVLGSWRKLHNEELHNSCSSSSTTRMIKLRTLWEGHLARMRSAYRILKGKGTRKRPLEKHRLKWEDNIKMDFK
jgi:hypothetical protein